MVTAQRAGVQRNRHVSQFKMVRWLTNPMILVISMKRKKREIFNQNKNDVTQRVNGGVEIITWKDMADYDWLKAKGTTIKM